MMHTILPSQIAFRIIVIFPPKDSHVMIQSSKTRALPAESTRGAHLLSHPEDATAAAKEVLCNHGQALLLAR